MEVGEGGRGTQLGSFSDEQRGLLTETVVGLDLGFREGE